MWRVDSWLLKTQPAVLPMRTVRGQRLGAEVAIRRIPTNSDELWGIAGF